MTDDERAQEFLRRWFDGVAKKDIEQIEGLFDDEMRFYTPVVHQPKTSRAEIKLILTWILEIIEGFHYVSTAVGPATPGQTGDSVVVVLWFRGTVRSSAPDEKRLFVEGADFLTVNLASQTITDFRVMLRPMAGYLAVADHMKQRFLSLAAKL